MLDQFAYSIECLQAAAVAVNLSLTAVIERGSSSTAVWCDELQWPITAAAVAPTRSLVVLISASCPVHSGSSSPVQPKLFSTIIFNQTEWWTDSQVTGGGLWI